MYCFFRLGKLDEVYGVFRDIVFSDFCFDVISFNILINGLCKNGYFEDVFMLYRNLKRYGCKFELIIYNIFIDGFCKVGRLKVVRWIF